MVEDRRDPKNILKEKLSERMGANSQYSLRAFARDLGISSQQLSNVMNGRKGISLKTAAQIASRLSFSVKETEYFCNLVQSRFGRSPTVKGVAIARLAALDTSMERTQELSVDSFRVVSDWYHFGLIELLKMKESKGKNDAWLSKRIGIPVAEVRMALQRLERLKLIQKSAKDQWLINQETLLTTDGVASEAIRKFHRQVLEKAVQALSTQSLDERYFSTSLFAVHPEDIPEAGRFIKKFRDRFTQKFSKCESGEQLYALGVQFIRLSNPQQSIEQTGDKGEV